MIDLPKAIRHLHAWNDGDPDNHPEYYGPDALEWQQDLKAVLNAVTRMSNAIRPKLSLPAKELLDETIQAERLMDGRAVASAIEFLLYHHDRTHKAMEP